ncbi:malate:quinone oxidoreductase, partial [Erwinia amylovora]|uniref:malate:quinone oxidoreductase n=1 Tax=Erwinia amylovora TaxID=552 RepID=UPI00200AED09
WVPLVMEGRDHTHKVAATRIQTGTDVNFVEITRQLVASLQKSEKFERQTNREVRAIKRHSDGSWCVTVSDLKNNDEITVIRAKYVF